MALWGHNKEFLTARPLADDNDVALVVIASSGFVLCLIKPATAFLLQLRNNGICRRLFAG